MKATYKVVFVIALMLLLSFPAAGAGITVAVLYFALRNPAITECVQSANGTSSLADDKDHLSYILIDEGSELRAGERVKL